MKKSRISKDELMNISLGELIIWDQHISKDYDMNISVMAASLRQHGQTSPLIVRKYKHSTALKPMYEIIDGAERFHAAKLLKMKKLHCLVRPMTDNQALLLQAINSEDKKVSGYERAVAYRKLLYENIIKQKDLAEKLGIAKSTLTRRMSFLKIKDDFWNQIQNLNNITDAIANEMVVVINKNKKQKFIPHNDLMQELVTICNKNPSISSIRKLSKSIQGKQNSPKTYKVDDAELFTYNDYKIIFNKMALNKLDVNKLLDKIYSFVTETESVP